LEIEKNLPPFCISINADNVTDLYVKVFLHPALKSGKIDPKLLFGVFRYSPEASETTLFPSLSYTKSEPKICPYASPGLAIKVALKGAVPMVNDCRPSANSITLFLFLEKLMLDVHSKSSFLTGTNVNIASIPLLTVLPAFNTLE